MGISSVMTFVIFYVMQSLIMFQGEAIATGRPHFELGFLPRIIESGTQVEQPKQFTELTEPLPPPPPRSGNDSDYDGPRIGVPAEPTAPRNDRNRTFSFNPDGPLVAIVRVQPAYPPRAAEQNLEGYVIVSFDVLTDGTTANVVVLKSSHRVFEKSAIEAAQRFRFKASVVDGVPLITHGVRNKFTFEMGSG
jgi:protein TonB